jgi:hypothetical protein
LQNLTRHADAAADQGLSETDRKALADLARQAAAAAQSMADTEAAAGNGDAAAGEGQPSGGAQAEGQAGDSDGGAGDGGARPDASASTGRRVIDPSSDGGRDDAIVDGSPDASRTERRDGAEGSDPAPGGGEDKDRKQTPEDLAGRLRDAADALQNGASARDVLDRLQQDMPEEALAFTPTARMVGPAGADWQAMPPADVDAVAPSETRSAAGDHAAGDDVTPQQADHIVREWQQRLDPEYQAVFEAYWKALGEQSPEE